MSILMMARRGLSPVQAGLRALYLFDEGAGQTLGDSSAGKRDGTLGSTSGADTNDPIWSAEGLSFSTDDFVDAGTAAETRPDAWTLCVAVKATPASVAPMVGWGSSSFPAVYGAAPFNANRPLIWLASNCFRYFESGNPVNLQDGGWHFLTFRCAGNTAVAIQGADLLADGQPQAVNSTTSATDGLTKTVFQIGAAGSVYFAEAEMAFLSLHDRALSDAEAESMRGYAKAELDGRVVLP